MPLTARALRNCWLVVLRPRAGGGSRVTRAVDGAGGAAVVSMDDSCRDGATLVPAERLLPRPAAAAVVRPCSPDAISIPNLARVTCNATRRAAIAALIASASSVICFVCKRLFCSIVCCRLRSMAIPMSASSVEAILVDNSKHYHPNDHASKECWLSLHTAVVVKVVTMPSYRI